MDPILVWYFRDSPSELGMKAQSYGEALSHTPARFPSIAQCQAARKQKRVREALRAIAPYHQAVLECVYDDVRVPASLTSQYGMAAPLIWRAVHEPTEATLEQITAAIATAHEAFREEYGVDRPPPTLGDRCKRWLEEYL